PPTGRATAVEPVRAAASAPSRRGAAGPRRVPRPWWARAVVWAPERGPRAAASADPSRARGRRPPRRRARPPHRRPERRAARPQTGCRVVAAGDGAPGPTSRRRDRPAWRPSEGRRGAGAAPTMAAAVPRTGGG